MPLNCVAFFVAFLKDKAFEVLQQHGLLFFDSNSGELSVTKKGRDVERALLAEMGYTSVKEMLESAYKRDLLIHNVLRTVRK